MFSSNDHPTLSRRAFIVTTLATGFAAAVRPVSAQTIRTGNAGLIAGEVRIPVSDGEEILSKVVSKVPDAQVMSDLDAAVAWAGGTGRVDTAKLAITGFCWGGRITWLYCAHNPQVKAGVAWYGRLVGQSTADTPKHPVDVAAALSVPVLGLYGEADQGIPLDTVERMRAALKQGRSGSEIVVYPGAPHGFHADYRPIYRRQAAQDGWKRMLDWFARHGAR